MIAIGGGGFIPARMLRCFLEIPIYAVTTAYYDSDNEGQVTEEVKKVQWLDPVPDALKGKNVLVGGVVDDPPGVWMRRWGVVDSVISRRKKPKPDL